MSKLALVTQNGELLTEHTNKPPSKELPPTEPWLMDELFHAAQREAVKASTPNLRKGS